MNCSMPGIPVHHQLPRFTQTHVHRDGDAIHPSHPMSSRSPPAPNPSQHQGLFQWVNSSHEVAKVLEFQLQHQSFQWTPRADRLLNGLIGSPCSWRDSLKSSLEESFWRAVVGGWQYIVYTYSFAYCNQSVPCPVPTVDSWPAYRCLKRQVRWSGIPISFRIFHSLLWSTQSKALA